jgi:hypothetical protein
VNPAEVASMPDQEVRQMWESKVTVEVEAPIDQSYRRLTDFARRAPLGFLMLNLHRKRMAAA